MAEAKFNEKQTKLMLAMIEDSAAQQIKYDWNSIAGKAGYANGASANSQWQKIKAKLKTADSSSDDPAPLTPKPVKTPKSTKKRGNAGDDDIATPTPAAKKAKASSVKTEPSGLVATPDLEEDADAAEADDDVKEEQDE